MKTLLVMQKKTDVLTSISLPSEKYSNIEQLIISRFTIEKTVQLLHKSASFLANDPYKIADWVNFVNTSFSALLYESSKILLESKNTEKIKNDLIEKLKVAEDHIMSLEFERKEMLEQLEIEKNLKIHLAQRLRKQESENIKKMNELIKLREAIQQSDMEKIHLNKKIERIASEFEDHRKVMAEEIFKLRKILKLVSTQKKEYLDAFEEFRQILNSLPFD